jgi:ribosomal protein S18 acetylase RimI-like enzyme
LRAAHGLSADELAAIAALEERVVAHDGGRLKLEFEQLRRRRGERARDVLAFDGERLVGFAGLYGPGPSQVEIAGMVDPDHRRRGLGSALLDAALELCAGLPTAPPLLIVPRHSAGGRALAAARDATLHHSEHALVLRTDPVDGPSDPAVTLRPARREDVADMLAILSAGFGFAPSDLGERLSEPCVRSLVVERDGQVVGTLRVSHDGDMDRIYGFAIAPHRQGQGIGRDALRRTCRALRDDGAREIGLEVEVDNDRALGLYTSLGFEPVITEDYWAIAA